SGSTEPPKLTWPTLPCVSSKCSPSFTGPKRSPPGATRLSESVGCGLSIHRSTAMEVSSVASLGARKATLETSIAVDLWIESPQPTLSLSLVAPGGERFGPVKLGEHFDETHGKVGHVSFGGSVDPD